MYCLTITTRALIITVIKFFTCWYLTYVSYPIAFCWFSVNAPQVKFKAGSTFLPFNVRNPEPYELYWINCNQENKDKALVCNEYSTILESDCHLPMVQISILQIVLIVTMLIAFGKCTIDLFLKSRGRSPSEIIYKNMVPFAESQYNVIM